jgi:Ser/Thr protein kinase RdoA (MazF antagonist)
MATHGVQFSSSELTAVLSHYEIGKIKKAMRLARGSKGSPKVIVTTTEGRYLLKRRPAGKDDMYRVAFAHAVQNHLARKQFPVAPLVATRDECTTMLRHKNSTYELFRFVGGRRYDGSAEGTIDTGRQLARFHTYLEHFVFEWEPLKASFHDSSVVRGHLKTVAADTSLPGNHKLAAIGEHLMELYNEASVRVNQGGFDGWKQQVVHGDWHPGNMLFDKGQITAIVDFDSVKIAPPVTDLANGCLQFSIVGYHPNPADWPAYLDQERLMQVLRGYCEVRRSEQCMLDSLADLMIETMIAEAVLPVAATGFFHHLSGSDFLAMIQRKADWINENRQALGEAIKSIT